MCPSAAAGRLPGAPGPSRVPGPRGGAPGPSRRPRSRSRSGRRARGMCWRCIPSREPPRGAPEGAGSFGVETDVRESTDDAAAVLERAYDAAGRFNPGVKIRVYRTGDQVQFGFAERPSDGDDVVPVGDMLIFVEGGI